MAVVGAYGSMGGGALRMAPPPAAPASTAPAANRQDAAAADAARADDSQTQTGGPRKDTSSQLMRAYFTVGMADQALHWTRWAAAMPYARANGRMGLWATAMVPLIGTGTTTKIVPMEGRFFGPAYRVGNSLDTVLSVGKAAVAIPNIVVGFRQGWDQAEGEGAVQQTLSGLQGLVATRAGRTGMMMIVSPAITGAIMVGAGWAARGKGIGAMLTAGQSSPLRGSFAISAATLPLGPLTMLNETGAFDGFNMDQPTNDARSGFRTLLDGAKALPETVRSFKFPFIPKEWVPQAPPTSQPSAPAPQAPETAKPQQAGG